MYHGVESWHGPEDEELKPPLEIGTPVYFTDRHDLDVVDGYIMQWLGRDRNYGDRYSVFSQDHEQRYDVWEQDLKVLPRRKPDPFYDLCRAVSLAVTIGAFIVAACGVAWMHSWLIGLGGGWVVLLGLIMTQAFKRASYHKD